MAASVRGEGWYRSHLAWLRRRYAELWTARRSEVETARRRMEALGARRIGRIGAGVGGVLGAVLVFGGAAMILVDPRFEALLPALLVGAWLLFGIGRIVGGFVGRRAFRRLLAALLAPQGELVRDVERLEGLDVPDAATSLLERFEAGSLAWPLAAASLVAPLTLHLMVWLLGFGGKLADFGKWIALSALIVGHAHLVLALLSRRYVQRLRAEPWGPSGGGWGSTLGWTIFASAIPGLVFFGLPPILVAVTGLFVIPTMFVWARRTLERERLAVAAMV